MAACVATERDSILGSLFVLYEYNIRSVRKGNWVVMLGRIEDQFGNSV